MHPVIRIVCLILLAGWLAHGTWFDMGIGAVGVALSYVIARRWPQPIAWRMLWRLRWLILPMLVLYGWMSPLAEAWRPDVEGLLQGGARATGLMELVLAVHLSGLLTTPVQWLAAIYWLGYPLTWLGMSRERLAVRMHLVMHNIAALQDALRRNSDVVAGTPWRKMAHRVDAGWQWAMAHANNADQTIEIEISAPPWQQWAAPLAMIIAIWVR